MLTDILNSILGVALLVFIGFVIFHIVTRRFREIRRIARKTLTLSEYINQYPQAKTIHGIKCVVCGSQSIKNWGLTDANDHRRIFICNHCNTRLYRSDDW